MQDKIKEKMSILNECQANVRHGTGLFCQQNTGNDGSKNIYIWSNEQ